jgi:transposase
METLDARSLSGSAQEALRVRVVKAVLAGMSQTRAAEVFSVSRRSVNTWVRAFRESGDSALRSKKRGRPLGGALKGWQSTWVVRKVIGKRPEQLRLPFCLWTREAVGQLIEKRFGIVVSIWTIGRYLKRWGFTPQKPVRRALERNPAQVRYWLKTKYPAISREAKAAGARIYWGDEMGLRSDHAVGRSYGLRGQKPVIPITGNRFGCNMVSAITNQDHLNFMVFEEKFTSDVFIEFLGRLVKHNAGRRVFLIADRHPVHRSRKVARWLGTNIDTIKMFFLPGYSPELNPDELLNQDVKSNSVGKRRAKDKAEMLKNIRGYLRSRQRTPQIIRRYFMEEHVHYAA